MKSEHWLIIVFFSFVCGYALSSSDHSGKEAIMHQFQSWNLQEQQDFIIAATNGKDTLKREIAEDWCAINKQTQRVCWNAKLNHPILGVK